MSIKYNVTVVSSNTATGEHNVVKFVIKGKTATDAMNEAVKKVDINIENYACLAYYDLTKEDDDTGIICRYGEYQKRKSGDIEYRFIVEDASYLLF